MIKNKVFKFFALNKKKMLILSNMKFHLYDLKGKKNKSIIEKKKRNT